MKVAHSSDKNGKQMSLFATLKKNAILLKNLELNVKITFIFSLHYHVFLKDPRNCMHVGLFFLKQA
jgi:hypothetical protein